MGRPKKKRLKRKKIFSIGRRETELRRQDGIKGTMLVKLFMFAILGKVLVRVCQT